MAETISVRLGDSLQKDLAKIEKTWHADRSEVIRRLLANALAEWKLQNALEQISAHKMSINKAAEETNLPLWEILEKIKEKNIDWTGYSDKALEEDLKILE